MAMLEVPCYFNLQFPSDDPSSLPIILPEDRVGFPYTSDPSWALPTQPARTPARKSRSNFWRQIQNFCSIFLRKIEGKVLDVG